MTKIIVDETLRSKLHNLRQPLEFCDESGRVLGNFLPAPDLSDFEPCDPEISEEELRQREESSDWYTIQEVLARLQQN
jgi:hypothetical protein